MLIAYKRFQRATSKFRKKYRIPETGIPWEKRAEWYQSLSKSADYDPELLLKFHVDLRLLPPNKKFVGDIVRLANEFNLDERWYMTLFFHLMQGGGRLSPLGSASVNALVNNSRLSEDKQFVTRLWINVRKDTSLSDIENVWSRVQDLQKKMVADIPEKRRPISSAEKKRYLEIRSLEEQGLTQGKIAEKLSYKGNVASDVAQFKNRIEKRFRNDGRFNKYPSLLPQ